MTDGSMTFGLYASEKKKTTRSLPKNRAGDYNITDPKTKEIVWFQNIGDAREYAYRIIMSNQWYRYHYDHYINIRDKRAVVEKMHNSKWGPVSFDPHDRYVSDHLVNIHGHLMD